MTKFLNACVFLVAALCSLPAHAMERCALDVVKVNFIKHLSMAFITKGDTASELNRVFYFAGFNGLHSRLMVPRPSYIPQVYLHVYRGYEPYSLSEWLLCLEGHGRDLALILYDHKTSLIEQRLPLPAKREVTMMVDEHGKARFVTNDEL